MSTLQLDNLIVIALLACAPALLCLIVLMRWLGIKGSLLSPVEFPITTIIGVVACMLSGMFLAREFWGVLLYVVFFFLMLNFFLRTDGLSGREVFSPSKISIQKSIFNGVGVVALALPVVFFLLSLGQIILISFGFEPGIQDSVTRLRDSGEASEVFRVVLLGVVAAPLVEEFLFRGIIYRRLCVHLHTVTANVIQAALFSFVHFYWAGFVPLFFLGFVLARLYEKSGSIYSCVVAHMLFNLFNIAFVLIIKWHNVA